jgi:enoyl-CoA hydratase/carnithine racemase
VADTVVSPAVGIEVTERIAIATLSSPPANALGREVVESLESVLDGFEAGDARVLVVRSHVPGYFAAGADLKLIARADRSGFKAYVEDLRHVIERLAAMDRPTIAAIDGHALGGGLELAMASTLRIATARARLGLPEVRLGLLPGAGGTQRLPGLVGRGAAADLLLSGRSIGGMRAFQIGLVDRLSSDGLADRDAVALARELAAGSEPAVAALLRCLRAASTQPPELGMTAELTELIDLFEGADAREGIGAFLAKRSPRFH